MYQQRPPVYTQQYQTAAPVYTHQHQTAAPVSQSSSFSKMVETSTSDYEFPAPAQHKAEKCVEYNPYVTHEQAVDIPFLHPVDIPQVIHDHQVVVVPQKVVVPQRVVEYQERLVAEKPTDIHHIQLQKQPQAAVFAEQAPESKWPWWWWLPLLALCCLIPCCIYLLYLCCQKKPEEAPAPRPVKKAAVKAAPPAPPVPREVVVTEKAPRK